MSVTTGVVVVVVEVVDVDVVVVEEVVVDVVEADSKTEVVGETPSEHAAAKIKKMVVPTHKGALALRMMASVIEVRNLCNKNL